MYRDIRYEEAKYRVKISHFTEKGHDITGVVHIGTNDGYEFQWYRKLGIEYFVGFEPLPSAVEAFQQNYPTLATGKEFFFPFALGTEHNVKRMLNVTQGDGQGSSFYEEVEKFAQNEVKRRIPVLVKRYDRFIEEISPTLPLEKLDCLVLDVQGAELEVLTGMSKFLALFKYLNIELSEEAVYQRGPNANEVIHFLDHFGFKQDSEVEPHNDVFFFRKDLV